MIIANVDTIADVNMWVCFTQYLISWSAAYLVIFGRTPHLEVIVDLTFGRTLQIWARREYTA